MADFQYDIGDTVQVNGADFEVVSRASNDINGELQYTVISKAHADDRRKAEEEAAEAERVRNQKLEDPFAETAPGDAAPAEAPEEPETLHPLS